MKFMSSFQCLMGGNGVQFQAQAQAQASSSSLDKDNTRNSCKKKKNKVIKVFKPDGEIDVYHKSIRVSEVMTEEYMLCRSDSFYIGQKIPPLPQHDRLQPGHTYFLLPTRLFHSVLSFVTIASFAAASGSHQHHDDDVSNNMKIKAAFLKKAAASSCAPFDIQKTPSGTLKIRVSELFISQLMMEQAAKQEFLCTTPELHREYKQLVVGSRRAWKPKLEVIKEAPSSRKVKLLLSASINRMKRKINTNNIKKTKKNKKKKKKKVALPRPLQLKKKKKKTIKLAPQTSSASIKTEKSS